MDSPEQVGTFNFGVGSVSSSLAGPKQNLAATLTNNPTASGLHRLLPKLKMHARAADALALSTGQGEETAFFRSSSGSFFIGVLRKTPAMAQLVTAEELLGKENAKTLNIPELAAAYATDLSFQLQSLQRKELVAAASTAKTSLQQKELAWLKAFKPENSTRAFRDQLDALQESPLHRPRASYSLMTPSLLSEQELSGKELVEHLAYPKLPGKETEKNIFLANCLGEKSLSLRKRSLEKKNLCILIIELMCLAFFAVLGLMNFDLQSLQQQELVAPYIEQNQSLQQHELVDHLAQLCNTKSAVQSFQLTLAQLCEEQLSNKSFQLSAEQLCRQESANKSLQLTSAQLCRQQSAERAYSSKSLQQPTLSMAQSDCPTRACRFSFQLSSFAVRCTQTRAFSFQLRSFASRLNSQLARQELVGLQLLSFALTTQLGSKICRTQLQQNQLQTDQLFQRGAFQTTSSAAASDTACFAARALQESGATAAFTTTAAAPATASYIASSQQTASATSLFAKSLVNLSEGPYQAEA